MADMVNFYDELGLDRGADVHEIWKQLQKVKLQSQAKAMRGSGSLLEGFKRTLELVRQAEAVFKDEDARERYDIALRRAGAPEEPATVDWVRRAWNYYFSGDNGAALIAARKAKEQSPEQPMAYVVSAWVWLREDEPQQAKRDADEAFVLDELGGDSVDVQEVRGEVYCALKEYVRAIASFDRGLSRASAGEKPELYWRKAVAHLAMRQPGSAYEAGRDGLSQGGEVPVELKKNLENAMTTAIDLMLTMHQAAPAYEACCDGLSQGEVPVELRGKLEKAMMTAIHNMDNANNPVRSLASYSVRRDNISQSLINDASKSRLLSNVQANIERCERWEKYDSEDRRLKGIRPPGGALPSTPHAAINTMLASLALGAILLAFAPSFSTIAFLIAAFAGIILIFERSKKNSWKSEWEQHKKAESALRQVQGELVALRRPISFR